VRVDEAALPPYKAAELATLTDDERKYFLDPDKVAVQGTENLKLLLELKNLHLKQFGRWISDPKPLSDLATETGVEDVNHGAPHQR
jgi:hypothetical protein